MRKPIAWVLALFVAVSANADVVDALKSSGVQGGIVVHLGCGDGKQTAALRLDKRFRVQGLETTEAAVQAARRNVLAAGAYGDVSVYKFDGKHLPYVDDFVNAIVASGKCQVSSEEIARVLAPRGVLLAKEGALDTRHLTRGTSSLQGWTKLVKPWPKEIDEWTHYLHGPDNNAVAKDTRVGIPRSIQWVSGPRWGRSHEELASMSAAVTARGRIYYIVDEAPLASLRFTSAWKLVARDAFNGTLLWKQPISQWSDHLRHFRAGPAHLPRRLVAAGDVVYVTAGLAGPVYALDGATGETIREYKGTERTEEILVSNGVLYLTVGTSEANRRGGGLHERNEPKPTDFRYVTAIDAATGKTKWKKDLSKENILPLSMGVRGQRVLFQTLIDVVCLDAETGSVNWRTPRQTPKRRMSFSGPTLVVTDGVVLCADRDAGKGEMNEPSKGTIEWGVHGWNEKGFARKTPSTLRAYSATDGKELWSVRCSENYNSPTDIFIIGGTVWIGMGFQGIDLKTGKEVRKINTAAPRVGMAHHRCYRNKASERFIFTGKSGVEVLSLAQGKWLTNNSWIRGTCQYGIIPANGLIYAPPDACGCFLTVKVPGFYAAAPQRGKTGAMPFPAEPVLEKGPLHGKAITDGASKPSDWPMYRHDAARSGAASCKVPSSVSQKWSAAVGGKLTQPVIVGGKVFVASIDTHTVHALSAADGKELWRYTAGGRVDSTPTIYKGMALFGCADGWIYCLGAVDGALVWRFRAAPQDLLVSAYGHLESIWPLHGSVLIQNDTVYAAAGRTSYTDGGIVLYRIEPATGKQLSRTVLYHLDPDTGKQLTAEARFNMEGTTTDLLTGDGERVYLKYFAFDQAGKRTQGGKGHLWSITGLLGEDWFVRSYWLVGAGMPGAGWGGWANAANQFPAGRILCFTDDTVYGYGRVRVAGGATGHRADAYHLFSRKRTGAPAAPPVTDPAKRRAKGKAKGKRGPKLPPLVWGNTQAPIVRAMVLAGDQIVVAGPPDLGKKDPKILAFENEEDAVAGFRGAKGIHLWTVSAADGKKRSQHKLAAMPVFDGLSAAGGRLFISLRNGTVECWGK